jgi:hypothetical protein
VCRQYRRVFEIGNGSEEKHIVGVLYIQDRRGVLEGWERQCLKGILDNRGFGKRVESTFWSFKVVVFFEEI